MFGYVKPVRCKLNETTWGQYRAVYCGLCHTLGKRFGFFARFIVNYDFTFLSALLLSLGSQESCINTTRRCCIVSPLRKKCVCVSSAAFERAADASVILFWWKLKDSVEDESFIPSIFFRALCVLFLPAYRKACQELPQFSELVAECLAELKKLEKENSDSIDRTSDTFARILAALSELFSKDAQVDAEEMLYHLGRFIYLIDSWDDLADDLKRGRYNPIAMRFNLTTHTLSQDVKLELEQTLCHSICSAEVAFVKLNCIALRPLLENIMNPGLFSVMRQISDGTVALKEKKHERSLSGAWCFTKCK